MEPDSNLETLRQQLEDVKGLYERTLLEKNVLQKAAHSLNFHDNAHEGIVYTDANGNVVYANPYFLQMMNIPSLSEMLERPLPDNMWVNVKDAMRLFAEIRDQGFVRERELNLLDRNGKPIYAVCSSIASKTDEGDFAGMEIMLSDITSRRTAQAELSRQNMLLDLLLASTPHPVLLLSDSSSVLRINPAGSTLFGVTDVPKNLSLDLLLITAQVPAKTTEAIQRFLAEGATFQTNVEIGLASFILYGVPIQNSDTRWVIVFNNISVLKEIDSLKSRMLRMASHDLKAPLSIIVGYTDLLMGVVTDEEQKAYLTSILQTTARMTAIITDLLDLDRSQVGPLALEVIELPPFMHSIVAEYESQAISKKLSLTVNQSGESISIEADPSQLREALRNLLDNAVKYTPAGGSIHVALYRTGEAACFEIADTGCGIPSSAMAHLFQPFFRARTRATINIPGTGLGLSLAKSIVESHGGRIRVESQEDHGSTFFIEIPLSRA